MGNFGAQMRKTLAKDLDRKLQAALVKARSGRKLTQVQLAAKLGKPQSYVSKYETGERKLSVGDFLVICEALKTKPEELLGNLV